MNVQKTPHTAQNRYKALYHNILHECGVEPTPHRGKLPVSQQLYPYLVRCAVKNANPLSTGSILSTK